MTRKLRAILVLGLLLSLLPLTLVGCSGSQSALDPQGPDAERLTQLFWYFTAVCGVVWLLVITALARATFHAEARPKEVDPLAIDISRERKISFIVGGLVAATGLVLIVLTLLSYFSTRELAAASDDSLSLEVTGYQWWWDVRYDDQDPSRTFHTANEIHVPTGQRVKITLKAADVIHSFWVPNITGKQDLIPGQQNVLAFTVTRPGTYRGQCAEFCGLQHAHMALLVIADPPAAFEAWRNAQVDSGHAAADPKQVQGESIFITHACLMCHAIRGIGAGGRAGPDLTHFGSRNTIAAGTLPNETATLAAWIADPQEFKPGNKMPIVPLNPEELAALTAYLEGLK
jgi:cytochrome c oxidase subunit II